MYQKMLSFTGIAISVCLLASCNATEKEHHEDPTFPVTTPLVADTVVHKTYVGQIRSINHIELRAQEKGYLQSIYVDEGQRVRKGQVLFKIMPNLYEAEVQKAQAEVEFADIEYQNTKALTDNKVVAPNELAMAKAKYNKAKADLDLMKTHLDLTLIKAPFDGILNKFQVRLGSFIEEGELMTELSDNSKMWVYFNVPESEYLSYMKKEMKGNLNKLGLKMANGEMFDYQGAVETIEADFDFETGNIPFRATFPNPEGLLRHGQTGSIVISTPIKGALLIPQKATFEILSKKYVFVIEKDGTVKSREIEVEAELPHIYAVKSGLAATDQILLEGIRLVKENQRVKVKSLSSRQVMNDLNLYAE